MEALMTCQFIEAHVRMTLQKSSFTAIKPKEQSPVSKLLLHYICLLQKTPGACSQFEKKVNLCRPPNFILMFPVRVLQHKKEMRGRSQHDHTTAVAGC